jgi:hypothetical protein
MRRYRPGAQVTSGEQGRKAEHADLPRGLPTPAHTKDASGGTTPERHSETAMSMSPVW